MANEWLTKSSCAIAVDAGKEKPSLWDGDKSKQNERAREYCAVCPVRAECLADALSDPLAIGIRAGMKFKFGSSSWVLSNDTRNAIQAEFGFSAPKTYEA